VRLANSVNYDLAAAVWTKDIDRAFRLASRIRTGQIHINSWGIGSGVELSFGGIRQSGFGREKGLRALDEIVWLFGGSLGRTSDGALAERAAVGDAFAVELPEGADAALAAGLGIAGLAGWLPFAWRAPLTGGENLLVLGATGSVGLVAVQTAKLLGAARVVAAGRNAAVFVFLGSSRFAL
jgi:NADPH:quinone reductase-like Zn-dependent oxidoreductase